MAYRCPHCTTLSIQLLVDLTKEEFIAGSFPEGAFYQHHASLEDLEDSASRECALCQLILGYLQNTSESDDEELSKYALAKLLPFTNIKIAINSSHVYGSEPLEKVWVFDTLMVQVGPWVQPGIDATDEEWDAYYEQPRLSTLEFNIINTFGT
jgi:hypothetical protein